MPRRELDFYETPSHYIAALFSEVNIFGRVYEPCAGEGAIADALRALPSVRKVITNDIDKKRKTDSHYDSTGVFPALPSIDWVITNPPFSDELAIVERMMDVFPEANVAFLARLSFLEPTEDREYFLSSRPPQQVIVLPRYSFRPNDEGKKQTDSVTCAWLIWYTDRLPHTVVPMAFWGRNRSQAAAVMRGLAE